jgi:hypothetical protein
MQSSQVWTYDCSNSLFFSLSWHFPADRVGHVGGGACGGAFSKGAASRRPKRVTGPQRKSFRAAARRWPLLHWRQVGGGRGAAEHVGAYSTLLQRHLQSACHQQIKSQGRCGPVAKARCPEAGTAAEAAPAATGGADWARQRCTMCPAGLPQGRRPARRDRSRRSQGSRCSRRCGSRC